MPKPFGSSSSLPVQMLSADSSDTLPPERKTAADKAYRSASRAASARLDLHSELPAELFSLPQMLLGTMTAFTSYGGVRRAPAPDVPAPAPSVPQAPAGKEHTNLPARSEGRAPVTSTTPYARTGAESAFASRRERTATASFTEVSAARPIEEPADDWPVYYVDDEDEPREPIDVTPLQPAEVHLSRPLKRNSRGIGAVARDVFCGFLSMAPYTAAIFMNILA